MKTYLWGDSGFDAMAMCAGCGRMIQLAPHQSPENFPCILIGDGCAIDGGRLNDAARKNHEALGWNIVVSDGPVAGMADADVDYFLTKPVHTKTLGRLICSLQMQINLHVSPQLLSLIESEEPEVGSQLCEALATNLDKHFAIFDCDNMRVYTSAAWLKIIGYTSDELKTLHFSELVYKSDKPQVEHFLKRAARGNDVAKLKYRLVTKSGEMLYVKCDYIGLKGSKGIRYHLAVFQDFTGGEFKARNKEQALILKEAQSIAQLGYWVRDMASGEVEWSDEIYKILGVPVGWAESKADLFLKCLADEDRLAVEAQMQRGLQTNEIRQIVARIRRWDTGEIRYINITGGGEINFADGQRKKIFGTIQDISTLKSYENELELLNKKLQFHIDAIDQTMGVSVTDSNGNIVEVNQRFCRMVGYKSAELLGQNNRMLNSRYHSQEFYNNLWQTIITGKVWRGEIRDLTKQGEVVWFYVVIIPLTNEAHEISGYYSLYQDITQQKNRKEEIMDSIRMYLETGQRMG